MGSPGLRAAVLHGVLHGVPGLCVWLCCRVLRGVPGWRVAVRCGAVSQGAVAGCQAGTLLQVCLRARCPGQDCCVLQGALLDGEGLMGVRGNCVPGAKLG